MSGRVTFRISLQPSRFSKSSSVGSCACSMVPIAPSATTTRVASASRRADGTGPAVGGRGGRRGGHVRAPWSATAVGFAPSAEEAHAARVAGAGPESVRASTGRTYVARVPWPNSRARAWRHTMYAGRNRCRRATGGGRHRPIVFDIVERGARRLAVEGDGGRRRWHGTSSRSNGRRRCCGCSRAASVGSASPTSPRPWAWPRAPRTASCAPSSTRASSSRTAASGPLPAGRRAAAPGQQLSGRPRAARPRPGVDRRPGPLQRRERPPGRAAPAGRADRAPRLPARRQPPGAGGRRHAAAALHRPGQGPVRLRPGGAQRGPGGRARVVHDRARSRDLRRTSRACST